MIWTRYEQLGNWELVLSFLVLRPGSVQALEQVLPEGFEVDQVLLVVVILYRGIWKEHKWLIRSKDLSFSALLACY